MLQGDSRTVSFADSWLFNWSNGNNHIPILVIVKINEMLMDLEDDELSNK